MGCCFSTDEDKDDGTVNASERTPLLDPGQADHISQIQGSRSGPNYSQPNPKGDEQSEFNRILRQTAINVIDVTLTESQNLEAGELQDRATQYSNRLNMLLSGSGKTRSFKPCLPTAVTSPTMVMAGPPPCLADLTLITDLSDKLSMAARDIKIQHKENLVVTWG